MPARTRLSTWLRLACALVLSVGLSGAAAAIATGSSTPSSTTASVSQLSVTATAIHSIAVRGSSAVRHAAGKHQPPAMASALAVAGIVLSGLAAFAVSRRRNDVALRHLSLSHGARAPPAACCI